MDISLEKLASIGFDMNRIAELIELFESQEAVIDLIKEMYSDSIGIIEEIQTYIEASNYPAAMQKSHYLKGVAWGVGAKAIAEAATALEDRLREKNDYAYELEQTRLAWTALSQVFV